MGSEAIHEGVEAKCARHIGIFAFKIIGYFVHLFYLLTRLNKRS